MQATQTTPQSTPTTDTRGYETLFLRHEANPILSAADWPYPIHTVFNPGAVKMKDGSTLLLCRIEDRKGHSHLTVARSKNGIDGWEIDSRPTMVPETDRWPEELWGIEDPRITYMPEEDHYVIAYTAYSKGGPGVSLATTKDFKTFERMGMVMQPDDKDAALLPRKFDGNYALIHRPVTDKGAHMWISYSPDLKNWGNHRLMMPARIGGWWDARKVGLCSPPIETERGWLVLYHGVRTSAAGALYRVGLALFDLETPEKCLLRGESWIMGPETDYERFGDVGYVVFPCGQVIEDDGDTIRLYYGAADQCIGLATGSIKACLDWLDKNGSPHIWWGIHPTEVV